MASTKTFSLLLILSMFSLTFATFIDPAAIGEAFKLTNETATNPNTIILAQESVSAAKEAGVNVLYYISSVLGDPINRKAVIKCIDTCNVTMEVAVKELDKCIKMMNGKTILSAVELQTILKSLNLATESGVKCNVSLSCKQTKADMQVMFENMLDEYIKMSKIAIRATSMVAKAASNA